MKKKYLALALAMIMAFPLIGCRSTPAASSSRSSASSLSLKGKSLHIYCGAGMTNPFKEIADAFQKQTGCKVDVTYGNAGQIQSQINTAKEGDIFIAGSSDELQPVKSYVTAKKDLVKHIPVLIVAKGNPKSIKGLSDLTKSGVSLITGDTDATPIGKIAKKALSDLSIYNKVNVVATATTAPQLTTAVTNGQADAAIVWKENASAKGVETVKTSDLDRYVKTVPAAALSCTADKSTTNAFMSFLDTDKATQIWVKNGYEVIS